MADLTLIISKESTHPNSYLWGPINNSGNNGQILKIFFSFKDAALQVLMSVCPSVSKLKFYLLTAFNIIAECSRMFQNVPECSRLFQNACRMFQNASRMFQNSCRMFQNSCRMFQNACRMLCSYISLYAVPFFV